MSRDFKFHLVAGNGWLQPTRGYSNVLKRNGAQAAWTVYVVSLHTLSKWGKERLSLGTGWSCPHFLHDLLPTLSPVQSSRTASPPHSTSTHNANHSSGR